MTDKEIVKVLECIEPTEFEKAPSVIMEFKTAKEFLDLINRQRARLHKEQNKNSKLRNERNRLKAEIERLKEIANPKCQQCVERTRKNSFVEFAEEFEKRCIEGGIYPAFVKSTLNAVKEELTEGGNGFRTHSN